MLILGIETSCDETAVALIKAGKNDFLVIDNLISSQVKIHAPFGGVVPNLAAREHLKNLPVLLKKIFAANKIGSKDIGLIAVTQGPGLIPALLIGTDAAKTLSYAWKKPLIGVHHIAGHIYANFIGKSKSQKIKVKSSEIKFPVLALIVSGGHTELIFMKKHLDFKIVGQTLDDAAGEAFDKVARILGLGYPGGPEVAAEAAKFSISNFQFSNKSKFQNSNLKVDSKFKIQNSKFALPRPMMNSGNLNFSFSGLKTAVLYTVRDNPKILKDNKLIAELCHEFQQAVIDVLIHKTIAAAKKYRPKTILLGGGVSANQALRKQLGNAINKQLPDAKYQIPDTKYSLDNAAMIAVAGYFQYKLSKNKKALYNTWRNLEADAGLNITK
jgi:N6-L-threonylcarbamoyladenine synthase